MTYYQKLEQAITNFEALELNDNEPFFIDPVMVQLIAIHDLMIFPNIVHEKFQQYIGWFRNDIHLDIQNCLQISAQASENEKLQLLTSIKKHVHAKLKVVEYAFSFYLPGNQLLNKEWSTGTRRITKKKTPVTWQKTVAKAIGIYLLH